ncbi:oxygenase MpaB family protein [Streptomyces caniscabiei]|uniref:oxygenase MpaB family protein n=1 Tax=Streptomyces caniscabiei TaxID=2746961 RepID=UPI0029AE5FA3|nr:oxygenase MpaB family protein [Streptomyces caniscabiei]MDX2600288.1 oxygenase MpaB family protein [Streptomyces caniscabiei]
MDRYARLREIESLDPERDYERIFQLTTLYEFPLEYAIGFEVAQVSSFAVPTIGNLLAATGEFTERGQKRNDDTTILLSEVFKNGLGSDRDKAAVRQINRAHKPYDISNDDFRYVLATLVVPPVRVIERYGWRPLTDHERTAIHHFFRDLGRHMAITDIPGSYEDMAAFLDDYEARYFAHSAGGHKVAMANRDRMAADLLPRAPLWLSRRIVDGLIPEHMRRHLGLPEPSRTARFAAHTLLKARAAFLRHRPAPTEPASLADSAERSYPNGYEIEQVGPASHPMTGGTARGCPFSGQGGVPAA